MKPDVRIRPMSLDDIDRVMAVAATLPHAPHWPRSGYEAALAPHAWPERIALLAESSDSRVAGFLIAVLIPPQAELESIAVAEQFQRHGLARRLLSLLAESLSTRNCSEIFLEVRTSNQPARAFYAASGFAEIGRRPAYYSDPIEDAIQMRRDLG